jgi:hypothetical protein
MFRALPTVRSYRSSVAWIERSVSSSYQEFPKYRAFVKGEVSLHLVAKMFGSAGAGNQYHHIVTQGGLNGKKFPAELLQSTRNVLPLPTLLHEVATDEYRKPAPDGSGRTLYPMAADATIRGSARDRTKHPAEVGYSEVDGARMPTGECNGN